MPPQRGGHQYAAHGVGDGSGTGRADHAHARAGDGDRVPEQVDHMGLVDQQIIQHHVDGIHQQVAAHGRPGVAGGAQHGSEDHRGRAKQHRKIDDEEISGGGLLDLRPGVHPAGNVPAQRQGQRHEGESRRQTGQYGLRRGPGGVIIALRAVFPGDVGQKADGQRGGGAAHHPVDGAGGAHRRRGRRAQPPHHGGIHILRGHLEPLLQHRRPRQRQHGPEGAIVSVGVQCPLQSTFLNTIAVRQGM